MTSCVFILYYLQLLVIVYPYSYSLTDYCLVCSTLPHAFSLTLCREAEPLRFSPYLLKCLTAIARMGAKVDGRKQTRMEGGCVPGRSASYICLEPDIRTVRFRDYRQLKLWNRQYGRELPPGTSKSPCRVVGGDRPLSSPEP